MKLLDKLKNTFFEEEYVEVEESKPSEIEVAKKIEPKKVKNEETSSFSIETELAEEEKKIEHYSESELSKKDNKLPYFEEEDFMEMAVDSKPVEEIKKIYGESPDNLYNSIHYSKDTFNKPYGTPAKESFKPTPIISPIYGILDKNYHKEEVVDKKERLTGISSYVSRKNADLDSVRKKAYGSLESLEETSQSIHDSTNEEENLLYDMTDDHSKPMVDKVTIADAEEYFEDLGLEYNIDYKDTHYEKATGRRTTPIIQDKMDVEPDEITEDENLFEIIDSIYEEGEE